MPHVVFEEEVACGDKADDGHSPAHSTLIHFATVMRAKISACASQECHFKAELPLHAPSRDEGNCWNPNGDDRSDHLERIHLVNVVDSAEAEECHYKKAAARAEVTNVDADHDHADQEPGVVTASAGEVLEPAAQGKAHHKHDGREEQQPREQFAKPPVAGMKKQPSADLTSNAGSDSERQQFPTVFAEMVAEGHFRLEYLVV